MHNVIHTVSTPNADLSTKIDHYGHQLAACQELKRKMVIISRPNTDDKSI